MRRSRSWMLGSALVTALFALAACAPAGPSPTAAPAKPAGEAPAGKPGAKEQPKTQPTLKPGAAVQEKPAGQPVTINAVTGWFQDYVFNEGLFELRKRLESKSGGTMKLVWKGGPEVAPPFEQIQPLKDGVFEMLNTSGAYYTQQVPEAVLLDYLDGPISELRKAGVIELFDEVNQQKAGVKLLGLTTGGTPYHLFTKRPIQGIDDFQGKKMRGTPTYIPLIEGLGASPVVMPASEIYTAMERGVVDGFAWPRMGIIDQKLYEVTCCIVDPGFWTVRTVLLMNVNAWNRLSPEQQEMLTSTIIEVEEAMAQQHAQASDKEVEAMVKQHGMQVIKLPEDQAKRYRQIAYTDPFTAWAKTMPDFTAKVQEMAKKVSPAWPPYEYHTINVQ